jgi:hypothetical protein
MFSILANRKCPVNFYQKVLKNSLALWLVSDLLPQTPLIVARLAP